jgi:pSer/pThr/pTyr-binding forkhead associated (FHA) protein
MNCSNCGKINRPGLLLCEYCGHQLITLSAASAYKTREFSAESINQLLEVFGPAPDPSQPPASDTLVLELLDFNKKFYIEARGHVSLGRADEEAHWQPTVDLEPYGAAAKGVSRVHADLYFEGTQMFLLEVGSANGTRVNGKRVLMGHAEQLHNGDIVELGKLRLRVTVP